MNQPIDALAVVLNHGTTQPAKDPRGSWKLYMVHIVENLTIPNAIQAVWVLVPEES